MNLIKNEIHYQLAVDLSIAYLIPLININFSKRHLNLLSKRKKTTDKALESSVVV